MKKVSTIGKWCLLVLTTCLATVEYAQAETYKATIATMVAFELDDEYEKYKKEGDDLFRKGDYDRAQKKYLACLEVPNFSNDTYATTKAGQCKRALSLKKQAEIAFAQKQGLEGTEALKQVLAINPQDPVVKRQLADFWEEEANSFYSKKDFNEAKTRYQEAIKYAEKKTLLEIQIKNCEQELLKQQAEETQRKEQVKQEEDRQKAEQQTIPQAEKSLENSKSLPNTPPKVVEKSNKPLQVNKPKKNPLPPIFTALVGIGAGGYAYLLNKQFDDKMTSLNALAQSTDPDGDGVVLTPNAYAQWQAAYNETKTAYNKNGLYKACVGVAVAAAVVEVFLIARKPSSKRPISLHLSPSHQAGLVLNYTF
jgi:tetratricopeptide (TPR) repeat protein